MKSFFRNLEMRRREWTVKEGVISELLASVKSVQYELTQDPNKGKGDDSIMSLCNVLESIFIHGLKENFADRMSSILGGPDQRPSPEFWTVLMIFSHSEIIKQICGLSQITTDIGRSRAWVRLSLNEGLLIGYLTVISQDPSALAPHYKKYAYLRDAETLNVTINVLNGLSQFNFSLPINSSMLNTWPNAPLLLAGVWTPPIKDTPVTLGTDIVKNIIDMPETVETSSIESIPSSLSRVYDEEEALKKIFGTPLDGSPLQSQFLFEEPSEIKNIIDPQVPSVTYEQVLASSGFEKDNEEDKEECVSEGKEDEEMLVETVEEDLQIPKDEEEETVNNNTLESYDMVIGRYGVDIPQIEKPDLQDVIQKFAPNKDIVKPEASSPKSPGLQKSLVMDEYEVIEENAVAQKIPEYKFLMEQLGKLIVEKGLVQQDFTCKDCGTLIGLSFAKACVCSLTGCYYCEKCFKPVESALPSKILRNWDFSHYQVSGRAGEFLKEMHDFPLFDVRKINPRLYLYFPTMHCLQKLRLQLNFTRRYLFTCHSEVKEQVKLILWPREYLYEHVHLYSISDLVDIPNGKLEELLKRAIKLSIDHVLACQLCSQRGFICEVCRDSKVIYPFDIETTYRCQACRTVYHLDCRQEECRKCFRIKKRKACLEPSTSVE